MSSISPPTPISRLRREETTPFRLTPVAAAIVAGLTLCAGNAAQAAEEKSVAELQAEVAKLKAALEKSQQELARKNGTPLDSSGNAAQAGTAGTAATDDAAKKSTLSTVLDAIVIHRKSQLETLKDVPTSVSVVTGDELEQLGATNITEVLRRVGNVNFNYGNPRIGSLTLRGITTGSNDQIDPTVGTTLDGVPIAYTPLVNGYIFTDIDTVDVTRGPQGTLGGKMTNIGLINFKTKAPTFTPEASFSQTFGDWNTLKTNATFGGAIIDDLLAWRGTFVREQGDGPYKNSFPDATGRTSYGNTDRTFGRVQFLLTPNSDFSAKLSIEDQPKGSEFVNGLKYVHAEPSTYSDGVARASSLVDTAYKKYLRSWFTYDPTLWNANSYYGYNVVSQDNNGAIVTGSKGITANLDWKLNGFLLQSITGYRSHWFGASNDEGTPFDITKSGGYITSYHQTTQEFRLTSDKGKIVDYTAGVFFLSSYNNSLTRTRYGSDAGAYQASDAQYNSLNADGAGQSLLRDSLNWAYKGTNTYVKNQNEAIYGQADWHLSEPLTLTTGYRLEHQDRKTSQGIMLLDAGTGNALTTAFGKGSGVVNSAVADQLAVRYFGAGKTYSGLSPAQQTQLKNAAALRYSTLSLGSLYDVKDGLTWSGEIQGANISLADKINDNLTTYASLQYGQKGGISQIDSSGNPALVKPESTTGYEAGIRANFLNKSLVVNADIFLNDISNFQQTLGVFDPVATAAFVAANPSYAGTPQANQYASVVGNAPGVRVKGVELDTTYTGIKNLSLRLAADYNDARYSKDLYTAAVSESDPNAAGYVKYFNARGLTLNNAPKWTINLSGDYRLPVLNDKMFHTSANYHYVSEQHTSFSTYDVLHAYGLLDLGIGVGRRDGLFDVNLVAKNALNTKYHVDGWNSYTPSMPTWVGVVFSAKL